MSHMNIVEVLRSCKSLGVSAPLMERTRKSETQSREALYRSFEADERAAAARSKESPLVRWAVHDLKAAATPPISPKTQ